VEIGSFALSIIYISSFLILFIGFLTATSCRDVIRLLISLELIFGGVFLSLIPLFAPMPAPALGIMLLGIFTSSSELMVLIVAIILLDRRRKNLSIDLIATGGDDV